MSGNEATYADFVLYECTRYFSGIFAEEFKNYSKLAAFLKNFENLPKIKEYMASNKHHKVFLPSPYSNWSGI